MTDQTPALVVYELLSAYRLEPGEWTRREAIFDMVLMPNGSLYRTREAATAAITGLVAEWAEMEQEMSDEDEAPVITVRSLDGTDDTNAVWEFVSGDDTLGYARVVEREVW